MQRQASGLEHARGVTRPESQYLALDGEFPDVIGVVVGDQHKLAQVGVAGGVRQLGQQVDLRILYEQGELLLVGGEGFQAALPIVRRRRGPGGGPVAGGPFRRFVVGIGDEVQNIFLRDAQMLNQMPNCRARAAGWR